MHKINGVTVTNCFYRTFVAQLGHPSLNTLYACLPVLGPCTDSVLYCRPVLLLVGCQLQRSLDEVDPSVCQRSNVRRSQTFDRPSTRGLRISQRRCSEEERHYCGCHDFRHGDLHTLQLLFDIFAPLPPPPTPTISSVGLGIAIGLVAVGSVVRRAIRLVVVGSVVRIAVAGVWIAIRCVAGVWITGSVTVSVS